MGLIHIGPYKSTKINQAKFKIGKLREEWMSNKKAIVLLNSKAKFFLTYALSIPKYDRIKE